MRLHGSLIQLTARPTSSTDRPGAGCWALTHCFSSKSEAECCVLIGLAVKKRAVLGVCFIPKLDESLA